MATLFADKIMSDIILVVGKTEYPSHKLILCTSSDVFQIMLHDSNCVESIWLSSYHKKLPTAMINTAVTESIIRKVLWTDLLLALSYLISSSIMLCLRTNSLISFVYSYSLSITVLCLSRRRTAFLTTPYVRKQVFKYCEA